MPLKASVGLSKKIGQENYGSLGANCQLELELDSSLADDAEAFHVKIRQLYALANQAVVDQLARQGGPARSNGRDPDPANGNGHATSENTNDNADTPASNKQIKFLLDLARNRHSMDLSQTAHYCEQAVGISDVYQLTKAQASTVIDRLSGKNGNGRPKATNGRRCA